MDTQIIDFEEFVDRSIQELKSYVDEIVQDVMEDLLQAVCGDEHPLSGEDSPSPEMEEQSVESTLDRGTTAAVSDDELADGDAKATVMDMVPTREEDLLLRGDAPSSEMEGQSVELTDDQGTTAAIPDVELADVDAEVKDVLDVLPDRRGEEVRNAFGDLVGWLQPRVAMPQLAPRRRSRFSAAWKRLRRVLRCTCCCTRAG